jgi:hypothetical protein
MPTLILLDNSLSMCKYTSNSELEIGEKSLSILNISQIMILEIIKSIKSYDTKESVALVSQSLKFFDSLNNNFSI